ncbi:hypothetical protein [Absidia glauca]|uniref:Uncharacterized protein n=1 Tax=Absidia glauca TaxID=4829 RepID=A0A163J6L2_ABSGL|nr:hypothetical protein [Absidia glauca]
MDEKCSLRDIRFPQVVIDGKSLPAKTTLNNIMTFLQTIAGTEVVDNEMKEMNDHTSVINKEVQVKLADQVGTK